MNTVKAQDLHRQDMADATYREAYEALDAEFALARTLLRARLDADLTQAEVARRMGTTESAVSRLESGRLAPSTRTLERYARATGHTLRISLEAAPQRR
jgi:ribosome-binding protein aMBF1 (putative translation factor)